jgi:IclR family acetate operon transcriptional repressor
MNGTAEITYLGRLLDTIEMLGGGETASSYRGAARLLRVPPSTAHRLLTLLLDRGYCDRSDDGDFRAGPRLLGIGLQALEQLPHWTAASSIVAELGEATGESVSFGLLMGDKIILIARHNSTQMLAAVASVGDVLSPHTSALGKAILARVSDAKRKQIIEQFAPDRASEILESLKTELETAVQCGYSVDEETFHPGLRCRAVSVIDTGSSLRGGISVSGPSVRFTIAKAEAAIPLLQHSARQLLLRPYVRTASTGHPSAMRLSRLHESAAVAPRRNGTKDV